ncbi:uncharacterized protein WCC33_006506 [Rhinophrynus dorsalis]
MNEAMRRYCGNEGLFQRRLFSSQFENSTDNFPLMTVTHLMSKWLEPKDITYPTPPYISLRENVGQVRLPPLKRRLFLDMLKKFDVNDLSYVTLEDFTEAFSAVYNRVRSVQTTIQDTSNKWIVYENGKLLAKSLQGPNINNRATFKISYYFPPEGDKKPITIKIEGTSYFLSFQTGNFKLQPLGKSSPHLLSIGFPYSTDREEEDSLGLAPCV